MKIKRNAEQIQRSEPLQLHEVMHESDINPLLSMPVQNLDADMDVGLKMVSLNEINEIHASGDFEQIVTDASNYYQFFLKRADSDNVVAMEFNDNEISIKNQTDQELSELLKIAATLDADLLDEFGQVIAQPAKEKSFFSFFGW